MTANLEPWKIVTYSNLINWMDMMMVLGTMKLQAGVEGPEVSCMGAMASWEVGMEALEVS